MLFKYVVGTSLIPLMGAPLIPPSCCCCDRKREIKKKEGVHTDYEACV